MVDLYCDEILTGRDLGHMTPDDGYQSTTKEYLHALPSVRRAQLDPVLIDDERVFRNMMNTEEFYVSDNNYFENVQKEIKPHMRKLVTDWMLEVCCDQQCHVDVFLLACNIMDRFLSEVNISKRQFQLVAAATMFIASKLIEPCPISGSQLVKYTDNTYQLTELLEMELVILARLKWDLCSITPYAFLEHLHKLVVEETSLLERNVMKDIKDQAETLIILCATEFRFSNYPPSMLSSAALAHSAQELQISQLKVNELINRLQILTRVENDCLNDCIYQIERTKEENSAKAAFQEGHEDSEALNTSDTSSAASETMVVTETIFPRTKDESDTMFPESDTSKNALVSPEKSTTPTDVDIIGFDVDVS